MSSNLATPTSNFNDRPDYAGQGRKYPDGAVVKGLRGNDGTKTGQRQKTAQRHLKRKRQMVLAVVFLLKSLKKLVFDQGWRCQGPTLWSALITAVGVQ